MNLLNPSVLALLVTAGGSTATYRVTSDGGATTYEERVEREEEGRIVRVVRSNADGSSELSRSAALELEVWRNRSAATDTELTARRSGDTISIQGTLRGKQIATEAKVDAHPWYQVVDLAVGEFVRSGKAAQEFWSLKGDDLAPRRFVFKRGGGEKLRVGDKEEEAVRVRFTLPGLKGSFWSSEYWVRKSDGRMIRFEGTRGPGTPRVIIELVDEE